MKLSHRLAAIATTICICIFIVCFLENELKYIEQSDGGDAVHGRQRFFLQRRFLNRDENSKVSAESSNNLINVPFPRNSKNDSTASSTPSSTQEPRDEFLDLYKYSTLSPNFRQYMEWPPYFRLPRANPTLGDLMEVPITDNMTNWEKFHLQISKYELFPENSKVVEPMLRELATQRIVSVEQLSGGTQMKLVLAFENGAKALFKPMRFPREVETLPNHFYFTDFERHNSEIASYHLDKALGFRRAPPCIGRSVNISEEFYPLAEPDLHKTFFVSPAGNVCFHGQCSYYCDTAHAICGNPHMLEGSLSIWLPPRNILMRRPGKSPWKRSYNKRRKMSWETDNYYCLNEVKPKPPFKEGRRLYDLMDLAIFDYLTGNMDRHHYEEIVAFGNESTLIHWDHGRGFGQASQDEWSIIYPLYQCCVIRLSTFNRLYGFHVGPKRLSHIMRKSMARDPLAPILTEPHLLALDRRVGKILAAVRNCLTVNPSASVFLDDIVDYPILPDPNRRIFPIKGL